jgi:FkbM family methyltransferase
MPTYWNTPFVRSGPRFDVFGLLWPLTSPLRHYAIRAPLTRGKHFVIRRLLPAMFPRSPACLIAHVPGGGRVKIDYSEEIALLLLLHGSYEAAEIESLATFATAGTVAIDVGANIGMYSVALAGAVGSAGRVLAFEPVPQTLDKLRRNIALNALNNIEVVAAAAGEAAGSIDIRLANDSAYSSVVQVKQNRATGETLAVPVLTLDDVWEERHRPMVSFCKVDVEGAEFAVLKGAETMLRMCRPTLLLEGDAGPQLDALISWLASRGYHEMSPTGFLPWNHLFVPYKAPRLQASIR